MATPEIEDYRNAERERIARLQRTQIPMTLAQWVHQIRLFESVDQQSLPWWKRIFPWTR